MKPLSEEKKAEIKRLRKQGMTQRQIAVKAGISQCSVANVLHGKTREQNRYSNIPQSLWDEWKIVNNRYGENGTHRAKNRLRTGR